MFSLRPDVPCSFAFDHLNHTSHSYVQNYEKICQNVGFWIDHCHAIQLLWTDRTFKLHLLETRRARANQVRPWALVLQQVQQALLCHITPLVAGLLGGWWGQRDRGAKAAGLTGGQSAGCYFRLGRNVFIW